MLDCDGERRSVDMSAKEIDKETGVQDLQWVACMGDFVLLKDFLSRKRNSFFWILVARLDSLLRGFGQVVFANNPISGIIIMIAIALTAPGTLLAGVGTGFVGLLLSMVSVSRPGRCNSGEAVTPHCGPFLPHAYDPIDTEDNIVNGLTVYNPVLIGSVTYALAPNFYGDVDAFAALIILVGTIFSVYVTRSLTTARFPCITVPFNVVEIIVLLVLTMQKDFLEISEVLRTDTEIYAESGENSTEPSSQQVSGLATEEFAMEKLNWGLLFRGVVASASQVYAVDNVAAGSVIYLGIVIYSPLTAFFSFFGAMAGCLVALGLRVPYASLYAGLWGYNSFLTGGAFGGLFVVMSGQTGAAAFVAMIFTTLFQYVVEPLLAKIGLPVLTLPFVVTAWLFFGLRDSVDGTFPRPESLTFPEHELHNFRSRRRQLDLYKVDDGSDPEILSSDEKISSND